MNPKDLWLEPTASNVSHPSRDYLQGVQDTFEQAHIALYGVHLLPENPDQRRLDFGKAFRRTLRSLGLRVKKDRPHVLQPGDLVKYNVKHPRFNPSGDNPAFVVYAVDLTPVGDRKPGSVYYATPNRIPFGGVKDWDRSDYLEWYDPEAGQTHPCITPALQEAQK